MTAEPLLASIFVNAPPERVYDYFTRPEAIVRWIGDYALLEAHPQVASTSTSAAHWSAAATSRSNRRTGS